MSWTYLSRVLNSTCVAKMIVYIADTTVATVTHVMIAGLHKAYVHAVYWYIYGMINCMYCQYHWS